MNFNEAYQKMLEGKKIKRPDWKGYWFIDSKDNKFKIKLAGGEIKENKFTQETIKNTAADDWEVMEEPKKKIGELGCCDIACENCPLNVLQCYSGNSKHSLYEKIELSKIRQDQEIYDIIKKRLDKEIEE